jgi:hypothetical protein
VTAAASQPYPPRGPASVALDAWDHAEPHVLKLLLKVSLTGGIMAATPFLALAFLFLLLEKPLLWIAIPASVGASLFLLGLVAYLVLRAKLRRLRARVQAARDLEDMFVAVTGR